MIDTPDLFVFLLTAMIVGYIMMRFWRLVLAVLIIGCFVLIFAVSALVYTSVQSLI